MMWLLAPCCLNTTSTVDPKNSRLGPEIEAQSKHILWLIRNRPEAAVLARPEGAIDYNLDPKGYSEGKKAWMDHWQRDPTNWIVLDNAAKFLCTRIATSPSNCFGRANRLNGTTPIGRNN